VSIWRSILLFWFWASVLVPACADPVNVVVGGTDCFVIRSPDGAESIASRVWRIHSVFANHVGRTPGRFTIRADGARRLISLDGDFLVAVTPADALATHHESAATLAPVWRDQLERAWRESLRSRDSALAPAAAPATTAAPGARPDSLTLLLIGVVLLALFLVAIVLLRLGRQLTLMLRQSTEWQRELNESLLQSTRLPALPAGESAMLTAEVQSEIARHAREQSQAVVGEAIQQICDSVERVMAGMLEEIARGLPTRPTGEEAPRDAVLSASARAAMPRPGSPESSTDNVEPNGGTEANGASENPPRRGPTALEITAYGKTYAFPMSTERARAVVEAWEKGDAVPEAWLHESGITTARLQPLLDRFVLRRQPADDGGTAYAVDPRGTGARFAVRNAS
jgi:hypothetical protein